MDIPVKNKKISKSKRNDLIFYSLLVAWPVLQFCVFYIGVNGNSILLAFKDVNGGFTFNNFGFFFNNVSTEFFQAIKTSLLFYVITTVITVPAGLLFSYYIFKKMAGSKFFRLMLFLPSILSSIVLVVIYAGFLTHAAPDMLKNIFGIELTKALINRTDISSYIPVMIFNIWMSFGITTLLYSNKMSEISPEMIEAGQLDGASARQEFFHIVLPFAFPTISVFLVTGIATIFTNQYNLFSFFGGALPFDAGSMGYYIYMNVQRVTGDWGNITFNRFSALGVMCTAVVVPITLTIKWALEKFGPRED